MCMSELSEARFRDNYLTVLIGPSLMYDVILTSERHLVETSGTLHLPELWGSLQARSRGSRADGD
jgi:hypothetical protein